VGGETFHHGRVGLHKTGSRKDWLFISEENVWEKHDHWERGGLKEKGEKRNSVSNGRKKLTSITKRG